MKFQNNTPYWVAMRAAERRICREALQVAGGDEGMACEILGLQKKNWQLRIKLLGGIRPGQEIVEPKGSGSLSDDATAPSCHTAESAPAQEGVGDEA